ncbi:hypothetical protein BC826DRAFT_1100693 [Russula brevipes]|nr:hypothetical protein BC826DRAFT_1100693 [Russula brevipes]
MSFSSLPRRLAFLSSSCHRIRSTRTVSSLSALEKRVDDDPDEFRPFVKIPVNPATFSLFPLIFPDLMDIGLDTGRVLEPSKTESYLSSLLVDGGPPTLRDLERLKPSTHSDPQSKEYALEYSTVLDSICRSFTNDQLRCFSQHYGLRVGSNRRKISYVEAIVEKAWRLPLPKGLKRTRRDRTMISQTLALTASELFILLGKDGSDLSQVSRKYNVHISVKPNPLAIYLEGSPESVTATKEYVDGDIVEETVDAAFPLPSRGRFFRKFLAFPGPS